MAGRRLPMGIWIMRQTWMDVMFAHWRVDSEVLRNYVPDILDLDTFEGKAWIGIIPFNLTKLRPRFLPPIPLSNSFPEVNLRTYVTCQGEPGVYFFSLDAEHRFAVIAARTMFHLPYFYARMRFEKDGESVSFYSERADGEGLFDAQYHPILEPFTASDGTLEHWLTERYRLYTTFKNRLYYEDIDHEPWSLQRAEATIKRNTLAAVHRLSIPDTEPTLHYAKEQHVHFYPLKRWKF